MHEGVKRFKCPECNRSFFTNFNLKVIYSVLRLFIESQKDSWSGNDKIKMSTSIIDYIFRELAVTYLGRTDLAHFTDEAKLNKGIDILSISGSKSSDVEEDFDEEEVYSEKIVDEIPMSQVNDDPELHIKNMEPDSPEVKIKPIAKKTAVSQNGTNGMSKSEEAKLKGYTGDICTECGSNTMVRNGTCLKCVTCGGTSGCS